MIVAEPKVNAIDVVSGIYGTIVSIFPNYDSIPKRVIRDFQVETYINKMHVLDWQYYYRWCFLQTEKGEVIPFPESRLLLILDPDFNPNEDVHRNLGEKPIDC